jgi:Tol biopolymer transport system component
MLTLKGGNLVLKRLVSVMMASLPLFALFASSVHAGSYPGVNGRIGYGINYPDGTIESVLPDGSSPKKIANAPASSFHWSPDGRKIVFGHITPDGNTISTQNIDGTSVQQIYSADDSNQSASWSPNGSKILFTRTSNGDYVQSTMNTDGTGIADVSPDYAISGNWSPDGNKIVYLSYDGLTQVYTMNSDGTNPQKLTSSSFFVWDPVWSPDGTKIAYRARDTGGVFQIFTMNADGSSQTQLTHSADHNYQMTWSPDGTKIAFLRQPSYIDIYTINVDGSDETKIVSNAPGANSIDWQPLTIAPNSETPNPTIKVDTNGKTTINIPSLYSDAYDGIDTASVAITSAPSNGTTTVDESGVVTYTQDGFAKTNIASKVFASLFPVGVAHAQSSTDSFSYRVCSLTSASLCSTGTVTVNLTSAPSSASLADTGQSVSLFTLIATSLLAAALVIAKKQRV